MKFELQAPSQKIAQPNQGLSEIATYILTSPPPPPPPNPKAVHN